MAGVFGGTKHSKHFEIRLDSPFAVFYGDCYEASPVELTGTVILDNSEHMNVRTIKIKLEGKWRVTFSPNPNASIRDKGIIISEEHVFFPSQDVAGATHMTHKIAPGTHEWRFKFTLDPSLPESVEGLKGSFVIYDLTAEIDRGYMSKNLIATKHVRVIRTLGLDVTDTVPLPYSNEETWIDKLKYRIYIPSRYFIFGTSIPVEFILMPLRKGITIGKIKMEVVERINLETGLMADGRFSSHAVDRVVDAMEQEVPEGSTGTLTEETTGIADESYSFKLVLPLKRSLNSIRQSVHSEHIKITHNLKIYINIKNPDGHVSQVSLRNLVHIYISPNIPINDDQSVSPQGSQVQDLLQLSENRLEAPPTYGTHILDQLYDDIDPTGFFSGVNTPLAHTPRNRSVENLHGLTLDSTQDGSDMETYGNNIGNTHLNVNDPASQLYSRLTALERNYRFSWAPPSATSSGYATPNIPSEHNSHSGMAGNLSPRTSIISRFGVFRSQGDGNSPSLTSLTAPSSRRNSHAVRPDPISIYDSNGEFDMQALARTPSYNTAVRSPLPSPPEMDLPPAYDSACSGEQTPTREPSPPARTLQLPTRAHVRGQSISGIGIDSLDDVREPRTWAFRPSTQRRST